MTGSGLQVALLAGGLVGAGAAGLIWQVTPAHPDLTDALHRLRPHPPTRPAAPHTGGMGGRERVGRWALRRLPPRVWGTVPAADLAVLRMSVSRFSGEKVLFFLVGAGCAPLLTVLAGLAGWRLPVLVPAGGSLAVGAALFLLPDHTIRSEAARARDEVRRALVAYYELVALERLTGSGHRQAMENAAAVGQSWIFRRLAEELARSAWAGHAPWDALEDLGAELGVPDLADLAQVMQLSSSEGTQVATRLQAKATSLRAAILSSDLARANEVGEKMSIPMSLLGVIFMALLVAPALLRVTGGG